jgi:hypothetical protein
MVDVFVLPLLLYSVWQAAYLLTTEVLLFQKMEEDPQLITSMRSIIMSQTNSTFKIFLDILPPIRRMGCIFL